jgi:hypothetical protein
MVAHTCNPSYLEGGDQEDRGLSLAWAKSLWDSPSQQLPGCSGTCLSSQLHKEAQIGGPRSRHGSIKPDPISKITKAKRAGGVV